MKKSPKVTVLMPVYNASSYIREAMDSVLTQTFNDFEFLIIDDGSVDDSLKIISGMRDRRIRIIRHETNQGLVASLNEGIREARGEYIARMDADDVCIENRLAVQVDYMDNNYEVGVAGSWVMNFEEERTNIWKTPVNSDVVKSELLFSCPLAHPSVILRKAALQKCGLEYDEKSLLAEDWDLWQRASNCFPMANIPKVLLRYRVTPNSTSRLNSSRQMATIYSIHERNLVNLNCIFDSAELEIHRQIGAWELEKNELFIEKAEKWLLYLKTCNEKMGIYPKSAFNYVIGERWAAITAHAGNLGDVVWDRFRSSELSRVVDRRVLRSVRLRLKTLLARA